MAHPSDHRLCSTGIGRLVLVLVCVLLVGYLMGPPLFWHSKDNSSVQISSCPYCDCDCSSEPTLPMPLGNFNSSIADCAKDDPDMNEEMKKDIIALLSEEISLQKTVTNDGLEHTKALIIDAKKTSSHYQKEAEKCNSGMETCEEARERAQSALVEERKLSATWEQRARDNGWKDERRAAYL